MKDCIHLIEEKVAGNPDATAVIDGDKEITYQDFWNKSLKVSAAFQAIKPQPRVLLDINQSLEAYTIIVACLQLRAIYCPLSPLAPRERKLHIKQEFNPDIVIVESEANKLDYTACTVLTIAELFAGQGQTPPVNTYDNSDEDIIYVIYTSGSTGQPKGVQIARCGLNKFLEWSIPTYRVETGDIWGQFSLLSFDLSIVDIFTSLCSGGTLLVLNDPATKVRPSGAIETWKINYWHSIPSAVDFMIKSEESRVADFSSLKLMSFCGEKLLKTHLEFLFLKNNGLRIFNTYGPTEGTLFCTWKELSSENYLQHCTSSATIGSAIPGWSIELVDYETEEEKEVVVCGNYIGRGYLGEVCDSKYKNETKESGAEIRKFRTGDLLYTQNGELYFSSRKDRQIKFMGYRIEPAEIDYWIYKILGVYSNTVLHNNALHAVVETSTGIDESELRRKLGEQIEGYKIPRIFVLVKAIPRNSNMKVDHAELLKLLP